MAELSMVDLQMLHLGIIGNGKFNENDIAKSELAKLGVGRILDHLASLKDKKLIDLNNDGSFSITEDARKTLWDTQLPTEIKILRVLEIAPQIHQKLVSILSIQESEIQKAVEKLQKSHLMLMSTIKNEMGIVKMYEIMPEGRVYVEKVNSGNIQNHSELNSTLKNIETLQDVIEQVKELNGVTGNVKNKIISNLQNVKKDLQAQLL